MIHTRACAVVIMALIIGVTGIDAQSPSSESPRSTFEAVSIKPNRSGDPSIRLNSSPDGGFTLTNGTLGILLGQAFPQSTRDMSGLPAWATSERWDVVTKGVTDGSKPDGQQRSMMLQAMLAERFKLKTHVENREQPAYDLALARNDGKLGPQLTPSDIDCQTYAAATAAARAGGAPPPPPPSLTGVERPTEN